MSLFLVCTIITLFSPLNNAADFSKVENIFQESLTIKPGDVLQCEITKTNLEISNNDYQLFTQVCLGDKCYTHQPISEKCFSFKVRAPSCACIMLNNVPYTDNKYKLEVILQNGPTSYIRVTTPTTEVVLTKLDIKGIINDREYSGFWIRWLDDELLEVGRESEQIPFLYHRFPKKLQIKFAAIHTCGVIGAWIIDKEPKCPGKNGTEIQKKMKAESDCILLS